MTQSLASYDDFYMYAHDIDSTQEKVCTQFNLHPEETTKQISQFLWSDKDNSDFVSLAQSDLCEWCTEGGFSSCLSGYKGDDTIN